MNPTDSQIDIPSSHSSLISRLTLLLEVNAALSSTIDLRELLRKIINLTSVVMQSEASSLALLDPMTDELVFQFAHGDATEVIETLRLPIGQGIAGWVAKYGVPLNIPDVSQDPRFFKNVDEKSNFNTRSVICVPLKRNDQVIGILQSLNKRGEEPFSEEDYLLFESLSAIIAIALENANLYQSINEKVVQLEVSNQRLESILNQLERSEDEINKLQQTFGQRQTLTGQIEVFRLENLLQMLSNDRKTGKLTITVPETADRGHIYLTDGRIEHAECYGGTLNGNEALFDLICWERGTFVFANADVAHPKTVEGMTMGLVIEGLRRLDEYNASKVQFPPESIVQMIPFERSAYTSTFMNRLALTPLKTKVMSLIDGKRTIQAMCREAKTDRYSVLIILKDLMQLAIIEVVRPEVSS